MVVLIKKKIIITITLFLLTSGTFLINNYNINENKAYIAIIIDDFGNMGEGTNEFINLEIPINIAIMPFLPYTKEEAELAKKAGKEILMHIPMEPVKGKKEWIGTMGITTDLNNYEIEKRVKEGLKDLKWAKGMNNHMGSKATADRRVIKTVMNIAQKEGLYFVDSITTNKSVISEIAFQKGVPVLKRDIFLDNSKEIENIEKQLLDLGEKALENGYAVGIGHVGEEGGIVTAEAIKRIYPLLEDKGIKFVKVSELIKLFPSF